ncbi:MAG: hypothetical protein GEU93_20415 [Propionibacteriales bacterium]|nr:hypothetical protein [Propionibacteriales bacterium]
MPPCDRSSPVRRRPVKRHIRLEDVELTPRRPSRRSGTRCCPWSCPGCCSCGRRPDYVSAAGLVQIRLPSCDHQHVSVRSQSQAYGVAERIAAQLVEDGASGVALTGSVALGEDLPNSDIDLIALTHERLGHQLLRRDDRLVSVVRQSADQAHASLYQPSEIGTAVPGWRSAIVLSDAFGVVQDVRDEAAHWTWERVAGACDDWVASGVTGLAEQVHRVAGLLRGEHDQVRVAAANRAVIGLQLAPRMAVHRRILYGSENRLWELVATCEGSDWAAAQDQALGIDGAPSHADQCRAALRLYSMAAERVQGLLDRRQDEVVTKALEVIEQSLGESP